MEEDELTFKANALDVVNAWFQVEEEVENQEKKKTTQVQLYKPARQDSVPTGQDLTPEEKKLRRKLTKKSEVEDTTEAIPTDNDAVDQSKGQVSSRKRKKPESAHDELLRQLREQEARSHAKNAKAKRRKKKNKQKNTS